MIKKTAVFILLALIFSTNVYADLTFSAPPRENEAQGRLLYGPMAEFLSKVIGEKVVYVHPQGWMDYSKQMRSGAYDIVFDGPHFAAWRIKHLQHEPVARLPGTLDFVVIARRDNTNVPNHHSISRGTLCGLASPNLGTVSVLAEFENDIISPRVEEVKGGFVKVFKAFEAGRCDAAVLRENVWRKKISRADKRPLHVLYKIKPMPNQTFTVSPRISPQKRLAITKALLSPAGIAAGENILQRFSRNAKKFVKCDTSDYKDLAQMLEGVVFGW